MAEPLLQRKRAGQAIRRPDRDQQLDARRPPAGVSRCDRSERRRQDHADRADFGRIGAGFRSHSFCRRGDQPSHRAGTYQARTGTDLPDHAIAERLFRPRQCGARRAGAIGAQLSFLVGRPRGSKRCASQPPIISIGSGSASAPMFRSENWRTASRSSLNWRSRSPPVRAFCCWTSRWPDWAPPKART